MYAQQPGQVNLKDLFIVLIAFVTTVFFLFGALANDDPLWFLPIFNETPARITLYHDGCRSELTAGRPGFVELTAAINQSLSQIDGYEQGFGLSPETIKEYIESGRAIQVTFPKRIKIHVAFRFGSPDTLFVPLSGSLADSRAVFGGIAGDYWASALRLKSIDSIKSTADHFACP